MELQELIDSLGISFEATFVPKPETFKLDRETLRTNPMLDWKIEIRRGGQVFSTEYHQGIGHLPNYPQGGLKTGHDAEIAEDAFKTGRIRSLKHSSGFSTKLPAPKLIDVLYSLLSDADALDHPTFEQWAADLGYDTDSRKGEAIYRANIESGLKLRALLGDQTLSELRQAYHDANY